MSVKNSKLITEEEIKEKLYLIYCSNTTYITKTGNIYERHGDLYYKRKSHVNKNNGYTYCNIIFKDGKERTRRLHRIMAEMFIHTVPVEGLNIVGHHDNIKSNYNLEDLYWTDNQKNSNKAIEDGLNKNSSAENDNQSIYIKVLDKDTKQVVGVYGSMRECGRCIENVDISTISKLARKDMYKPRSKKYIYLYSTKEEFDSYPHLQNIKLIEFKKANKKPKKFRIINESIGYNAIMDNQVQASKICGINQAYISYLIKTGGRENGWRFEYIGEKEYSEASCYNNFINTLSGIKIRNINTGEIKEFKLMKDMAEYFGLTGNDQAAYARNNNLIKGCWKVLSASK